MLKVRFSKGLRDFELNMDFAISECCMGILGPSGCGKSITLKCLAGLKSPKEGKIVLNDDILYSSKDRINMRPQDRKVGYLFQNYALFPNMTVKDNIRSGVDGCSNSEIIVSELLDKFHIEELANSYPSTLSGGQQQRVALARIIAYNPRVLLLDEPFSAMDAYLKEELRLELMTTLREYPSYQIIVSHDRDEIYQLTDKLIVMEEGKILEFGNTFDIFNNPSSMAVARLTGCKNISRAKRINDHMVYALDWDINLWIDKGLDKDVIGVGIRAHDLIPLNDDSNIDNNTIAINSPIVSELPFEWEILTNKIWWKQNKSSMPENRIIMPTHLKIPSDKILIFSL